MASSSSGASDDAFVGLGYQPEGVWFSKLSDVFINHRGPDVKETIALELYKSLEKLGIRAFDDRQELELGNFFTSTIKSAIRLALVQIAIFSKGYGDSPWCLAELQLILQSDKTIIPIFYGVPPLDHRWVEKGLYPEAFIKYKEKNRYLDKLDKWKETIYSVSFINGYKIKDYDSDLEMCENVVSAVQKELRKKIPLDFAKHPVGITEILQDFERTCWQEAERTHIIIGICGLGGSGKTTLATSFFNRIRLEFSRSSFMSDVRETNLTGLQCKFLKDLFREDRIFYSIPEGNNHLRSRLGRIPDLDFLICIDDIDDPEQMDALVGWDIRDNASTSLIIVTSRDEGVLKRALLYWNAFRQKYPELVKCFVEDWGGLPLSLQVLGGHVFGSPNKTYWEGELHKLRRTLPHQIDKKLIRCTG